MKSEKVLCKRSRNLRFLSFYVFLIAHDLQILVLESDRLGLLATPEDDVTAGAAGIGCACGTVIIGCACLLG